MEEILKIAVIAIISVILALVLSEKAPVFALCTVLTVGIFILAMSLSQLDYLLDSVTGMIENFGMSMDIFQPVIKVCVIAVIVKISGDLCRDAGFSAVAQKIQFAGSISSVIAVFPLFLKIIALLQEIV